MNQIVIVELFLGIAGRLYLSNILILNFAVFLIVLRTCGFKKEDFYLELKDLIFIFQDNKLLFAFCVFGVFFSVKTWINLINPPICPDSLQYHLSFPATWLKSGNLNNPLVIFGSRPTSAELTALMYYPINAELFFFWLMAPLKNAFLADIGEAPFYFIGIAAIYSILRKFSIKKEAALFIGLLWALIPNVFKQLRTASQIDVICAALLLIYLNQLIILYRKPIIRNGILLGITIGMLAGTKVLNVYWLIALAPLSLYYFFKTRLNLNFRYSAALIFTILFFAIIFGGFSYIKSFILTGNPFYPVNVTIFGKQIFPGFIEKDSFSNIFVNWKEFSLTKLFFREGLGIQFLTFILPGTFVPLLLYPFVRRKNEDYFEYALLFLAPFLMFLLFLFVIKAYWTRYLFPYLGIGLITGVIFLDRFKWKDWFISIFGVLSIIISAISLANRVELVVSLIATILLFILALVFRTKIIKNIPKFMPGRILLFGSIVLILSLCILNAKYDREEFSRYSSPFSKKEIGQRDIGFAWKWLDENTGKGMRVAYTGRSEFYPFFGEKLKNDVFYVSVNNKPALPHLYPDGLYRKEKDYQAWKNNLKRENIDLLFVALPYAVNNESDNPKEFPVEDQWALEHPQLFKPVYKNSLAHIYSVTLRDQ